MEKMRFDSAAYKIEEACLKGEKISYRMFGDITYVGHPVDEIQKLNIYVPEAYYQGEKIGSYQLNDAPVLLPNTVGGYVPGERKLPGVAMHGEDDIMFRALQRGYVVVSVGVRGRGLENGSGKRIGVAPAAICDLKAAVRYLHYNADVIPGNAERIISNGTSAGGALSALLGASGNHFDYDRELEQMGACRERDDIFAASCYCPITNLEHADMAYEWEFGEIQHFRKRRRIPSVTEKDGFEIVFTNGELSEEQQKLSRELKQKFPAYLNSLHLRRETGEEYNLDGSGNGSFKEYIKSRVIESARKEMEKGGDLSAFSWLKMENGQVTDLDFADFIAYRTRLKDTPAFDQIDLSTPENHVFGSEEEEYRHFTDFSMIHSSEDGQKAEERVIKQMNPMAYIDDENADTAQYYRIRHGTLDRDTSLAISAMLALKLCNRGVCVDFSYPWGIQHAGDYDMEEMFAWVDRICGTVSRR